MQKRTFISKANLHQNKKFKSHQNLKFHEEMTKNEDITPTSFVHIHLMFLNVSIRL